MGDRQRCMKSTIRMATSRNTVSQSVKIRPSAIQVKIDGSTVVRTDRGPRSEMIPKSNSAAFPDAEFRCDDERAHSPEVV